MFPHFYDLTFPHNPYCNDWCDEYLSIDASALAGALGSSSTRRQGFAKSALNKGCGKPPGNLLAFLILLIIYVLFQVQIKKLVLERASTG